jgi:kinesin family protein 11
MVGNQRTGAVGRASIRQPPPMRTSTMRHQRQASAAPPTSRTGAISPADSILSTSVAAAATAGTKRKERDFDAESDISHLGGEATNINVVVRCRGRNDREVGENSAVVVRTEGVKGKNVDLSMGPNALSNKTYNFDRVFSPAADQSMIFDDVVKPILDEVCSCEALRKRWRRKDAC